MPNRLLHNILCTKLARIGLAIVLLGVGGEFLGGFLEAGPQLFAQTADTTQALNPENEQIYTVQAGETLFAISKKLGATVEQLKDWNNLSSNALAIGQQLRYPALVVSNSSSVVDSGPSTGMDSLQAPTKDEEEELNIPSIISNNTSETTEFYIVKSGDNLIRIARTHAMSVAELKQLNELESDFIRVGQRLTVKKIVDSVAPVASLFEGVSAPQGAFLIYTVDANDVLDSLLLRFELRRTELEYLNPDINIDALENGQKITILAPPSRNYTNPYTEKASLIDIGHVPVLVYSAEEMANPTTTGELYNPLEFTSAHSSIRLGQVIFIENPDNGIGIYVRINDRVNQEGIKLSQKAFKYLGYSIQHEGAAVIYTLDEL